MAATISVKWIIKIRVIGYIDMRFTLRQLQVFVAVAQ
ncbi:MAG: LysR family transcriptional regulator, partial [Pseudomonas sp.]